MYTSRILVGFSIFLPIVLFVVNAIGLTINGIAIYRQMRLADPKRNLFRLKVIHNLRKNLIHI